MEELKSNEVNEVEKKCNLSEVVNQKKTIGRISEDGYVERGRTDEGYAFKDYAAYDSGIGICYVPELCGNIVKDMYKGDKELTVGDCARVYTKKDFIDIAKGNEKNARTLFELVDWVVPSRLYHEMEADFEK